MPRTNLSSAMVTEVQAGTVYPVAFVETVWSSGTTYDWTGLGSVSWNGQTWTGGNVAAVSPIQESTDVAATGVDISYTAIDAAFLALALANGRQGNAVTIWFGFRDSSGAIISDPYRTWRGRMDAITITEGRESSSFVLRAESRFVVLTRPRTIRYSSESQKAATAGDKGFDLLPRMKNWKGQWGAGPDVKYKANYREPVDPGDTTLWNY